jgi:cobalt/nickel transport system permease protein
MGVAAASAVVAAQHVARAFTRRVQVIRAKLATLPHGDSAASVSWRRTLTTSGKTLLQTALAVGSLVFILHRFDIPVLDGASWHFLGGVFVALFIGPALGFLKFVIILLLQAQAFILGDGGVASLGANILNMGVIGVLGGYGILRTLGSFYSGKRSRTVIVFCAALISTAAAIVAASIELSVSGVPGASDVPPPTLGVLLFFGCAEGVGTVFLLWVFRTLGIQHRRFAKSHS